jgi:L-glyceraldehyde reductase
VTVVHWPVAFEPGNGLVPPHPTKEGEVLLDLKTSLVDTWKTMIKLKETGKVSSQHG